MGPIKNPINKASSQKISYFFVKYKNIVDRKRPKIQTKTVFSEPILSSYLPRIKHPIIPDKLINTPRKRIWDSENSNRKEANNLRLEPPTVHPKTEGSRLPSPPLPGACLLVACDYPKAMRGVVQSIYTGSKKNFRDEDFHIAIDFLTLL